MIALTIRTDKPEAEVGLFDGSTKIAYSKWPAHKELSVTLNVRISEILNKSSISMADLTGIVVFKGPGSFTGLRIGFSVANALAYAQNIPVVAAAGDDWLTTGLAATQSGQNQKTALPEYGAPAASTPPKK